MQNNQRIYFLKHGVDVGVGE